MLVLHGGKFMQDCTNLPDFIVQCNAVSIVLNATSKRVTAAAMSRSLSHSRLSMETAHTGGGRRVDFGF